MVITSELDVETAGCLGVAGESDGRPGMPQSLRMTEDGDFRGVVITSPTAGDNGTGAGLLKLNSAEDGTSSIWQFSPSSDEGGVEEQLLRSEGCFLSRKDSLRGERDKSFRLMLLLPVRSWLVPASEPDGSNDKELLLDLNLRGVVGTPLLSSPLQTLSTRLEDLIMRIFMRFRSDDDRSSRIGWPFRLAVAFGEHIVGASIDDAKEEGQPSILVVFIGVTKENG